MLKKLCYTLGMLIPAYLLGFYTRGLGFSENPQSAVPPEPIQIVSDIEPYEEQREPEPKLSPTIIEEEALPPEEEFTYADVPYNPANPVERLQSLERVRYNVPGSAFTRLVGKIFDENDNISASMSSLMELSLDESDYFNGILDDTAAQIREIEAQAVSGQLEPNGELTLVIPSFTDRGAAIRSQLLNQIENELGPDRRYMFEMMLLQKPSSFGSFGSEPMAVRNPMFEMANGWREIVTIDIGKMVDVGTEDERFEGVRKSYQLEAFRKRYGHFFKLD